MPRKKKKAKKVKKKPNPVAKNLRLFNKVWIQKDKTPYSRKKDGKVGED